MNKNVKIFFAILIGTVILTNKKLCEHLGYGQYKFHQANLDKEQDLELPLLPNSPNADYFINDTIYRWDDYLTDWIAEDKIQGFETVLTHYDTYHDNSQEPKEVTWEFLMNVKYRLRYFKEIDLEMYSPVFNKAQKALDGQEVIIEGFVIPFDQEGEIISLSFNPYASCFFCGKASPASIISMYLEDKSQQFKIDDFKKFQGTLELNVDDPNEFYYILRNARML